MKKIHVLTVVTTFLFSLLMPMGASQASATLVVAKKYAKCSELNSTYPGGVAKTTESKNTKKVNGKKVLAASKKSPVVDKDLYSANKKLDRDKDGIACEK
jgi:hypothetical protein